MTLQDASALSFIFVSLANFAMAVGAAFFSWRAKRTTEHNATAIVGVKQDVHELGNAINGKMELLIAAKEVVADAAGEKRGIEIGINRQSVAPAV